MNIQHTLRNVKLISQDASNDGESLLFVVALNLPSAHKASLAANLCTQTFSARTLLLQDSSNSANAHFGVLVAVDQVSREYQDAK
jgi:hypothetical protein